MARVLIELDATVRRQFATAGDRRPRTGRRRRIARAIQRHAVDCFIDFGGRERAAETP